MNRGKQSYFISVQCVFDAKIASNFLILVLIPTTHCEEPQSKNDTTEIPIYSIALVFKGNSAHTNAGSSVLSHGENSLVYKSRTLLRNHLQGLTHDILIPLDETKKHVWATVTTYAEII